MKKELLAHFCSLAWGIKQRFDFIYPRLALLGADCPQQVLN